MAVGTLTLSDFLLARIAEDEQWVRNAGNDFVSTPDGSARILAECEAKRQVVTINASEMGRIGQPPFPPGDGRAARYSLAELTIRLLALPYADHEDYQSEWRP